MRDGKLFNLFNRFNGRPGKVMGHVDWPTDPGGMVVLGRAVSIVYESDKFNGGGDGEPCLYEHKFHKDDLLLCDESGKLLAIVGPRLHVNERGIVN